MESGSCRGLVLQGEESMRLESRKDCSGDGGVLCRGWWWRVGGDDGVMGIG